ncbi:hypothetical protein P12x_002409 [Tundrisphaera lichenicola]|uniref:hypothetical protein n=1 Tax=Tundrisphaera lichenicola TaxID=2029860 RepID=UPI003EBB0793
MTTATWLLSALTLLAQAKDAPSTPGQRIDLGGEATLFVPEGYRPSNGEVDVVLHLHGASSVVEPALVAQEGPAVLIEFNRKGLSSVYTAPFSDRTLFPRLLDRAIQSLKERGIVPEPKLGRVTVSSFSAGFGGVRELLKVPEHVARIDTLIMADSLYAGYEGDPADRVVDPKLMADFRAFAILAASGEKTMVLTHSSQVPQGYASTTETADDLLRAVEGVAKTDRVDRGGGWVQTRSFRRGNLTILGFEGAGPEDHMRHLRRIADLWKVAWGEPVS